MKKVLDETDADTRETLAPIEAEIKGLKARQQVLEQQQKDKKADEITDEDKKNLTDCHEQLESEQKKREETIAASAAKNDVLHQLIDLALLRNGLLKGEALDKFLKRSVNLMK